MVALCGKISVRRFSTNTVLYLEYAAKLKANGVPVELVVAKETTHGFLHALCKLD